jgi:TP901 family phage tail tape measure protein
MTTEVDKFKITLEYDTATAEGSLGQFRARVLKAFADIQERTAKIEVLKDLSADAKAAETNVEQLRARVAGFKTTLQSLSRDNDAFNQLTKNVAAAQSEITRLDAALQKAKLNSLDLGDAQRALGQTIESLKQKSQQLRAALEGPFQKGDAGFAALNKELRATESALASAEKKYAANAQKLQALGDEAKQTSDKIERMRAVQSRLNELLSRVAQGSEQYKILKLEIEKTENAIFKADRALKKQTDDLQALEKELGLTATNTKALAAEQLALAAALERAQKASAVQGARQTLGIQGADELRAQLANLQNAYNTLRTSGTASLQELAVAKSALVRKTIELNESQALVNTNMQQLGVAVLGLVSSTYAYSQALRAVIASAARYEQGLASIASITNLNKAQLDALGDSVLRLSGRIGLDATSAFKALYNIIGSGIPAENAISVLEASAKAAVAGLTSVENAARIGVQVLNAYQLQTSELPRVFDILFQTVRDGVISFEELADKFGLVLPAARSAGVSLEELSGATVVLTRSGLNAPRAMVALEGAIKQLAAPTEEAAAAAAQLGIRYNGLLGTIEQLSKLNLGPDLLRKLIPDVEGQRAVSLLRAQVDLFKESALEAAKASDATQKAFNKLKDTPEQELKKFNAEVNRAAVALGKAVLEGALPLLKQLTELVRWFANLPPAVTASVAAIGSFAGVLTVAAVAARTLTPILAPLAAGLAAKGGAASVAAAGLTALQFAITRLIPVTAALAIAFAVFEGLADKFAPVRAFGKYVEEVFINKMQQLGAAISLLKNIGTLNFDGAREDIRALAELTDGTKLYGRAATDARNATAELEVAQIRLAKAIEEGQKKIGEAGAKYQEAFSPAVKAVDDALTVINNRIQISESALNSFVKSLAAASEATKTIYETQSKALEQSLVAETAAIEKAYASRQISQVDALKKETEATTKNYKERLALVSANSEATLRLLDIEAEARRAIARKTGEDISRIEIELRDKKLEALNAIKGKYDETYNALVAKENALLKTAKDADEARRKSKEDTEAAIREASRNLLSPYQAYYDRVREIDSLITKSQAERLKGNLDQAEEYAKKAIALSGQIGAAVQDKEGNVVVSARQAALEQTGALSRAGDALEAVQKKTAATTRESAAAYGEQAAKVKQASDATSEAIKAITEKQKPDVNLKVVVTEESINAAIGQLSLDLKDRAPLVEVQALFTKALTDYGVFKKSVEDNAPSVIVNGKFEALQASTKAAIEALPKVNLEVKDDKIKTALGALKTEVDTFSKSQIVLTSNVDDIAAKVKLLQKNTESTHTIREKYIPDPNRPRDAPTQPVEPAKFALGGLVQDGVKRFAAGGLVPEPWQTTATRAAAQPSGPQRFARGGFVGLVPGIGNTDSVRTRLEEGSFVLNKANSNRLLGVSGSAGASEGATADLLAKLKAQKVFERESLLRSVLNAALQFDLRSLAKYRSISSPGAVDASAEQKTINVAQQRNESFILGYRKAVGDRSVSQAESYTNDAVGIFENAKKSFEGISVPGRFAEGGQVQGGTVDALVTPGERVFSPAEVRDIGLKRLQAMNASRSNVDFGKALLARYNAGGYVPSLGEAMSDAIMPTIRKFNSGGVVNNTSSNAESNSFSVVQNVHVSASEVDARALAQKLFQPLEDMKRRRA